MLYIINNINSYRAERLMRTDSECLLHAMAGEVEFELSIEVLQAIEMIRFRGKIFLRSGAFSEIFVTDSGSSRSVDPWSG